MEPAFSDCNAIIVNRKCCDGGELC